MSGSAAAVLTKPAFRKIEWLARDIAVERRPDGVIILKSRIPLQAYKKHIRLRWRNGRRKRPSASGWRSAAGPSGNGARSRTAKPSAPSTG